MEINLGNYQFIFDRDEHEPFKHFHDRCWFISKYISEHKIHNVKEINNIHNLARCYISRKYYNTTYSTKINTIIDNYLEKYT